MRKINSALRDLLIGIIFYFCIAEITGFFIASNKLEYTIGLVIGAGFTAAVAVHMYKTLDKALDMEASRASKYVTAMSILRILIYAFPLVLALVISQISFIAVVIGIFGLKISALFQPLINKFISSKIFKEGR